MGPQLSHIDHIERVFWGPVTGFRVAHPGDLLLRHCCDSLWGSYRLHCLCSCWQCSRNLCACCGGCCFGTAKFIEILNNKDFKEGKKNLKGNIVHVYNNILACSVFTIQSRKGYIDNQVYFMTLITD